MAKSGPLNLFYMSYTAQILCGHFMCSSLSVFPSFRPGFSLILENLSLLTDYRGVHPFFSPNTCIGFFFSFLILHPWYTWSLLLCLLWCYVSNLNFFVTRYPFVLITGKSSHFPQCFQLSPLSYKLPYAPGLTSRLSLLSHWSLSSRAWTAEQCLITEASQPIW